MHTDLNLTGATMTATTTAWGNASPLDVVLERIAANTAATTVELAIGARPVDDPDQVLDAWRDQFTFIGHHTLPLGEGENLRPDIGGEDRIVEVCQRFGLTHYSAHPPNRKHATVEEFYNWAASYHDRLAAIGVGFSVETMYVPTAANEIRTSGGYHLARPAEVDAFCAWAVDRGWERPLLVDASHLHIGWCRKDWTERQILDLLAGPHTAELHISENDGRVDAHRPLTPGHPVAGWVAGLTAPVIVDEGRRRGPGGTSRRTRRAPSRRR